MCLTSPRSSLVSSPEIPNAEVLLHADCNEQEVMCELSRYSPRGMQESLDPAYFMVSLSVDGVDFSTALILQTLKVEKEGSTLTQNKLGLPLSQTGTLLTEGEFNITLHVDDMRSLLSWCLYFLSPQWFSWCLQILSLYLPP